MAGLKGWENSLCYTSEIRDSILWSEFIKLLNIFLIVPVLILSVPMETVMDELRILWYFLIFDFVFRRSYFFFMLSYNLDCLCFEWDLQRLLFIVPYKVYVPVPTHSLISHCCHGQPIPIATKGLHRLAWIDGDLLRMNTHVRKRLLAMIKPPH